MHDQFPTFEQHPVPQNISSYQFRLIGDMTVKQFFQLAGGALIALLFYASPFPGFIKWPLIIFFALAGAAFAFLPLEERPLEEWVKAFFRSVYSPTIYTWQKTQSPSVIFAQPTTPGVVKEAAQESNQPQDPALSNLEKAEKNFFDKFTNLFSISSASPPKQAVSIPPQPVSDTPQPETTAVSVNTRHVPKPSFNINVNENEKVATKNAPQTLIAQQIQKAQAAQFSPESAPPAPPTQPNIVVGQTISTEGKIIEGAILEIKDAQGRPVRALKSNKAGHFLIVTPLNNGKYQITVEKEGFAFDPIEIEANGQVIQPIAIKAKSQPN